MTLSKLGSWLAWFIPIFWRRKQRERLSHLPGWGRRRTCDPSALSPLHPVPKAQNPPSHWRMNPEGLGKEGGIRKGFLSTQLSIFLFAQTQSSSWDHGNSNERVGCSRRQPPISFRSSGANWDCPVLWPSTHWSHPLLPACVCCSWDP